MSEHGPSFAVPSHWKSGQLSQTVIFDSLLYRPGGMVQVWMGKMVTSFTMHARRYAPMRSGQLRAGISGDVRRVAPKSYEGMIRSRANHTMFVIGGTTGPIMSRRMFGFRGRTGREFPRGAGVTASNPRPNMAFLKSKGYLLNVRAGNGHPQRYAVSVSGQDANNFMFRAWAATARNHRSIRGVNSPL